MSGYAQDDKKYMSKINEILTQIGLTDKEIKIYLACLELGAATVQQISEKSGVKRVSIYNFLSDFKKRNLLTEIKDGRKTLLVAEDPHMLLDNAKDKIKQTENQIKDIEEIIPNLMSVFNVPGNKAKIRYYHGIEGLKNVYRDTLIPNSKLYGFIDADQTIEAMGDWIWEYLDNRVKMNIDYSVIAKPGKWFTHEKAKDHKEQLRHVKFVKNVKFETEIDLYANKVAIYSFKPPYAGVIIEDQAIHQTMMSIWKLLWDNLTTDGANV